MIAVRYFAGIKGGVRSFIKQYWLYFSLVLYALIFCGIALGMRGCGTT